MEIIQHLSLWWLWLAAVAAGAFAGALYMAVDCLVDRVRGARGRRT